MSVTEQQLLPLLGIDRPIVQAPMAGGPTTVELVAAVSNGGALGSLGAAYMQPNDLKEAIRAIKKLTGKPFAVNLFAPLPESNNVSQDKQLAMCKRLSEVAAALSIEVAPVASPYIPDFEEQLEVVIQEKVPVFSFVFGVPEQKYLQRLKENNTKLLGTATCLDEALQLQEAGVDAIVAQGIEAGGHRGTFHSSVEDDELTTLSLVALLNNKIALPIIAAGGIADAKACKAAFAAGAQVCQLGTAFLTTHESGAHPMHKSALLNTQQDNTVLTRAFSGRVARGIKNQFIEAMRAHAEEILPFPVQNKLSKQLRLAAAQQNNPEFMSLWAGQSAKQCLAISAAELVKKLAREIG